MYERKVEDRGYHVELRKAVIFGGRQGVSLGPDVNAAGAGAAISEATKNSPVHKAEYTQVSPSSPFYTPVRVVAYLLRLVEYGMSIHSI